jgi:ABC-type glycerol-3-phosphate transport system permease component
MRNPTIIAVGTTALTLIIAIPTAYGLDRTRGAILAAVGSLPVLVVFIMAQRRLATGLSLGAVK